MAVCHAKILAMLTGAEIGKRVFEAREAIGMSANKLAKLVGTRHQHIRLLENGGIESPGTELIQKIAMALDVPVSWLLGVEEPSEPFVLKGPPYMEHVRDIQVNLQTLGELDEGALDEVDAIVRAMIERRMKTEKEERDAARRRRAAGDLEALTARLEAVHEALASVSDEGKREFLRGVDLRATMYVDRIEVGLLGGRVPGFTVPVKLQRKPRKSDNRSA
jgi:transcriptional regulator with XRE-family HTH domain